MAPAKPARTLFPTTFMSELPSAAAANSAGPRCPTKITLTKDTSLFSRNPVDTGIDKPKSVYISPLLSAHHLRRSAFPGMHKVKLKASAGGKLAAIANF